MAKRVISKIITENPVGGFRIGTTFVVVSNKAGENAVGIFDDEKHKTNDDVFASAVRVVAVGRKPVLLNLATLIAECSNPIDWGEFGRKNSALDVADFCNKSLTYKDGESFTIVAKTKGVPSWSKSGKSWTLFGVKRANVVCTKTDKGFTIDGTEYTFESLDAEFAKGIAQMQDYIDKH